MCETSNMVIALEALRNGDTDLNAASCHSLFVYIYLKKHLDGTNCFAVGNIQNLVEEKLFNRLAIGTERVLWIHHLFTKPGF